MAWNAVSDFILDQLFGYQTATQLKNNIVALASARIVHQLGGSRVDPIASVASAQDAVNWIDAEIDGTLLSGLTAQLRVECRTDNVGTSVTPKLRNVTDSTDAGTGVACAATDADFTGTNQKQTVAVTLATGVKKYRLMGTPSNVTDPTYVIGYVELFATA